MVVLDEPQIYLPNITNRLNDFQCWLQLLHVLPIILRFITCRRFFMTALVAFNSSFPVWAELSLNNAPNSFGSPELSAFII